MIRRAMVVLAVVLTATAAVTAQRPPAAVELKLDRTTYALWDTVNGSVGGLAPGENFKIEVRDSWERLILHADYQRAGVSPTPFSYQIRVTPTMYFSLKAVTTKGRTASADYFVIPPGSPWDDFPLIVGGNINDRSDLFYDTVHLLGITNGVSVGTVSPERMLRHNFRYLVTHPVGEGINVPDARWEESLAGYVKDRSVEYLERKPGLSDPEALKGWTLTLGKVMEFHKNYGPLGFSLGDGLSVTRDTAAFDYSYDPQTLELFRNWLRERYKTVGVLNRAWDTKFRGWEDVVPMTAEQVLKSQFGPSRPGQRPPRNLAPWSEHLAFMDLRFADILRALVAAGHNNDRITRTASSFGIFGARGPAAYGGYDWANLTGIFDFLECTDDAGGKRVVNSLNRTLHVPAGTLAVVNGRQPGPVASWRLWNDVLTGNRGALITNSISLVDSQDRLTEFALDMSPTLKLLTEGTGRLLVQPAMRPVNDGVTLYYSPPSVRVQWMLDVAGTPGADFIGKSLPAEQSTIDAARLGWMALLDDLRVGYGFIDSGSVIRNPRVLLGTKILILPKVVSLSKEETDAIIGWVNAGGTVIADSQTGIYDESGRELKDGQLDALFGIRRSNNDTSEVAGKYTALTDQPVRLMPATGVLKRLLSEVPVGGMSLVESGVENRATRNYLQAGRFQGLFIRRIGQGSAVYLNLSMLSHRLGQAEQKNGMRELMSDLLALAGVKPSLTVEQVFGPPTRVRVFHLSMDPIELVAILPASEPPPAPPAIAPAQPVPPPPLQTKPELQQPAETPMPPLPRMKVMLPRECYVYEVMSHFYLGKRKEVELPVPSSYPVLIACLPYEVKEIVGKVSAVNGQLQYEIHVEVAPRGRIGTHVFRIQFWDPKGDISLIHSTNVTAPSGNASGALNFVPGDMVGNWKMQLTDILSGKQSEMVVEVR